MIETLCLLATQHCGKGFLYNEYQDYNAGVIRMPGLVVVDVIGHRLCRGHDHVHEHVAIEDGAR